MDWSVRTVCPRPTPTPSNRPLRARAHGAGVRRALRTQERQKTLEEPADEFGVQMHTLKASRPLNQKDQVSNSSVLLHGFVTGKRGHVSEPLFLPRLP